MNSKLEAANAWWIGAIVAATSMLAWGSLGEWTQNAAWTVAAGAALPSLVVSLATLAYVVIRELRLRRRGPVPFVRPAMVGRPRRY